MFCCYCSRPVWVIPTYPAYPPPMPRFEIPAPTETVRHLQEFVDRTDREKKLSERVETLERELAELKKGKSE